MQSNPSDTSTQCYTDTMLTNESLIDMSDTTAYLSADGYYQEDVFFNLLQVTQIQFVKQLESCNYMQFLISLDGMLSNIPQATAAAVNMATQLATGFENQDTSVYISVSKFSEGYNDSMNWETFGQAFQLFLSQLLKVSAGDTDITVSPTGF